MREFRTTPLIGSYVRLEPLAPEHLRELCETCLDLDLWTWMPSAARTRDEMTRFVETALAWRDAGHALPYATLERHTARVVGTTRFANWVPEHARVEIGWTVVAKSWQNTAINTEAKLLMLRFAFEQLAVNRVELKTDALNSASRAAISRLGAREEGTLRRHMITWSGRVRDTVYYSVIREEWPELDVRLLERLARHERGWSVWRADDHGNRVELERGLSRDEARRIADELEARDREQTCWIDPTR